MIGDLFHHRQAQPRRRPPAGCGSAPRPGGFPAHRNTAAGRNLIIVNSGHRDFVFATRRRALQLRYLVRLYAKELVLRNFTGLPSDRLLERMIELSLYAEDKLK